MCGGQLLLSCNIPGGAWLCSGHLLFSFIMPLVYIDNLNHTNGA